MRFEVDYHCTGGWEAKSNTKPTRKWRRMPKSWTYHTYQGLAIVAFYGLLDITAVWNKTRNAYLLASSMELTKRDVLRPIYCFNTHNASTILVALDGVSWCKPADVTTVVGQTLQKHFSLVYQCLHGRKVRQHQSTLHELRVISGLLSNYILL
jgi:hypothetical protein